MKLIYIEWQDAHAIDSGWKSDEEIEKFSTSEDFIVKQVGWIIKETKTYTIVAGSRVEPGEFVAGGWGEVIKIPKSWIRKRIDLTKYIK